MILQLEWAWQQLLQTFAIEQTEAQHALASLVRAYASPGRVYHTLDDIDSYHA